MNFSDNILLFFQNKSSFLDTFFYYVSYIADEKIFLILLSYICFFNKDLFRKIIHSFIISSTIVYSIKNMFKVDRPFVRNKNITPTQKALKTADGYSFPSGHTQAIASGFMPLYIYFKNIFLVIIILLVSFSRIYLGVHSIYDVLFSLILSMAISYYVMITPTKNIQKLSLVFLIIYALYVVIQKFPDDAYKILLVNIALFIADIANTKIKMVPHRFRYVYLSTFILAVSAIFIYYIDHYTFIRFYNEKILLYIFIFLIINPFILDKICNRLYKNLIK